MVVFVTLLSLSLIILEFKMNTNVCQAIIMGLVTLWGAGVLSENYLHFYLD